MLEPRDCRFYPDGKIQEFDGVESEWPMFFAFMVIDGVFHRKPEQVEKYQELLKQRLCYNEQGGDDVPDEFEAFPSLYLSFSFVDPVLPQYYYVDENSLITSSGRQQQQQHKRHRHAHMTASNDGCSTSDLHLWAQSLLVISDLLTSQLLNVHELDPIRRHLPSHSRPKWGSRYSAFEVRPPLPPYVLY